MGRHRKCEMVCVGIGDWPGCGKTFRETGKSLLCDDCRRLRRSAKQHDSYVAQVEAIVEGRKEDLGPAHGFASLGSKRGE